MTEEGAKAAKEYEAFLVRRLEELRKAGQEGGPDFARATKRLVGVRELMEPRGDR